MALIHILDKQTDEIVGTLNVGDYYDDEKHSSIDNQNTFDFVALKHFDKLQKRNRLLVQDIDGYFSEYVIEYTEQISHTAKNIWSVASFLDLKKAKIIEPQTLTGATANTAAEFALDGTEWQVGRVESTDIRTITIEEYTNPYSFLKQIASASIFGLELRFRVVVDGNRIVGRFVDLLIPDMEFDGKEVTFGKDLVGLRRKEDSSQIVTALLGIGPEREDGTRLTVFVEDRDALQRWGRNGQHLIEVYEPETSDMDMTIDRLRTLTENELKKRIEAVVEYECEATIIEHIYGKEHEKIRLGDTIRIKDEGYTPPLYLEARIQEINEKPSLNRIVSFKLGNYKEFQKEDLEAQIDTLKKLLAQKASTAKLTEVYETALQQAEEKANQAEANAKTYADVVSQQAESNAKNHADLVTEQKKQEAINAAIADADAKLSAAKTELETDIALKADAEWVNGQLQLKENAIHRGATAPTDTTKLWLDTSVVPNVLKRHDSATSSWVKATPTSAGEVGAYTKTEVDNALNSKVSATQYNTDMNGVITRLDSAESRITQTENEIATKVEKSEFNSVTNTLGNHISAIEQTADSISLEVSDIKANVYTKSEVDSAIDDIQVGGRNLIRNTSDKNKTVSWSGWDYNLIDVPHIEDIGLSVGDPVVFRVYIEAANVPIRAFAQFYVLDDGGRIRYRPKDGNIIYEGESGWSEVKFTISEEDVRDLQRFTVAIRNTNNSNATATYRKAKMERGNKATDWTPAPEDIDAQIADIEGTLESHNTKIEQNAQQIQLRATKTEVDTLSGRVNQAESQITQLAGQIELRATKTEVDALSGRVSTVESTIQQHADMIESKIDDGQARSIFRQEASSFTFAAEQINFEGKVFGEDATFAGTLKSQYTDTETNYIYTGNLNPTELTFTVVEDGILRREMRISAEGIEATYGPGYFWNIYNNGTEIQFANIQNGEASGGFNFIGSDLKLNGVSIIDAGGDSTSGYIRFANGIQLCWGWIQAEVTVGIDWVWWLPAPFVDANYTVFAQPHKNANDNQYFILRTRQLYQDRVLVRVVYTTSGISGTRQYAQFIAVGRWK